jgi:hypothetical protein
MGRIKNLLAVLLAVLLLVAGAGIAGAAKLVVDRNHGQVVDLSGLTGTLGQGWTVVELREPLTEQALSDCSLLVVPQPVSALDPSEVDAIVAYVRAGGGLLVLGEADGPKFTALQRDFGVSLDPDRLFDYLNNGAEEFMVVVPENLRVHPILQGVDSFVYADGCSLSNAGICVTGENTEPPSVDLVVTGHSDVISYSSAEDCYYYWSYSPVLAATTLDNGRAVFVGDTDSLAANQQLFTNIVNWLKKPEAAPLEELEAIEVTIKLRPWNPHNKINLNARGFIRVAIMSDSSFQADQVDPETVVFAGASPVSWKLRKVNRDRLKDLVLVFWIPDLRQNLDNEKGLTCTSTKAELTGNLLGGTPINGFVDPVHIVQNSYCTKPPKNDKCGGKNGR